MRGPPYGRAALRKASRIHCIHMSALSSEEHELPIGRIMLVRWNQSQFADAKAIADVCGRAKVSVAKIWWAFYHFSDAIWQLAVSAYASWDVRRVLGVAQTMRDMTAATICVSMVISLTNCIHATVIMRIGVMPPNCTAFQPGTALARFACPASFAHRGLAKVKKERAFVKTIDSMRFASQF